MKKLLFILALAFASCEKNQTDDPEPAQPTNGSVTFYIYPQSGTDTWVLLVDGHQRGTLNESTAAPACSSSHFITLSLLIGNHTIDAQNMNGHAWGNPQTVNVTAGCETYEVIL